MSETNERVTPRWMRIVGWVLSALVALPLGVGGAVMLANPAPAMKGMVDQYGYPPGSVRPLLVVELAIAVLFLIPRTAAIGAILITGYLGGAIATHVRAAEPTWPMPAVMAVLAWLALYFRDARVRAIMPWHR